MRPWMMIVLAGIFVLGMALTSVQAQEPDSLKVKNKVMTKNQEEAQKLRIRTQEQVQTEKPEEAGEQNRIRTRNEGEEDKLRVRTEEGDKAQGEAVQTRFRDENGDGIPDSTQAQKKERNRNQIRTEAKKQDGSCSGNMTPQGAAAGSKRQNRGGDQGSGTGRH